MRNLLLIVALGFLALPILAEECWLRWTAPGDDGMVGQAYEYDLRFSTAGPVTPENFSGCERISPTPYPAYGGELDSFYVEGMSAETTYWFAMKASDAAGNWSDLSNCVSYTPGDTIPPAAILNLEVDSLCVTSR